MANVDSLSISIHQYWRTFLIEGIVLVVLGAAAVLLPALGTLAVTLTLGWVFLLGGIVGLIASFASRGAPGFWWSLVSAIITLGAGLYLIGFPVGGAVSLTFVLTAFLVADGLLMILFAIDHRRALSQRWIGLMINGVLDLVLAAVIVLALPGSALWALGLIVGIDLIFGGFSLIAMAMVARSPSAG